MKNPTSIKIPKKYHNMIREIYHDEDGYWVNTEKGFQAAGTDFESHTIHVDTSREVLEQIRQIKVCNCNYCQGK